VDTKTSVGSRLKARTLRLRKDQQPIATGPHLLDGRRVPVPHRIEIAAKISSTHVVYVTCRLIGEASIAVNRPVMETGLLFSPVECDVADGVIALGDALARRGGERLS
jgi:hypothetical protein